MEIVSAKVPEGPLQDTSSTSFSRQQSETEPVDTKLQRPASRSGDTHTSKVEKPSQFFYQAEAISKQPMSFEHPAALTTHTPVKYSAQTEGIYNRIISSTTVRQHSPKHAPTLTVTPPSALLNSGSKFYHPVSATTTVHQPISVLPHTVSSVVRSPTVVQVSPVMEVTRIHKECCEHEHAELERLQTLNDFLTDNYAHVYGRLKELEKERAIPPKPAPTPVRCIDEAALMRIARDKLDFLYEDELQSAITKLRNMSTVLPQFRRAAHTAE